MVYQLRFKDGTVEPVDEHTALSKEQLAAVELGRATLVSVDEDGTVVVLVEVDAKGDVVVLAGVHDLSKQNPP